MNAKSRSRQETGFFESYAAFARALRTWFLAYGVGTLTFLFGSTGLSTRLISSGKAPCVVLLVLAGAGIQVLVALLYKAAMWQLYIGEFNESYRKTRRYRCADWISECFLLEIASDLATIAVFAWATWVLYSVVCADVAGPETVPH